MMRQPPALPCKIRARYAGSGNGPGSGPTPTAGTTTFLCGLLGPSGGRVCPGPVPTLRRSEGLQHTRVSGFSDPSMETLICQAGSWEVLRGMQSPVCATSVTTPGRRCTGHQEPGHSGTTASAIYGDDAVGYNGSRLAGIARWPSDRPTHALAYLDTLLPGSVPLAHRAAHAPHQLQGERVIRFPAPLILRGAYPSRAHRTCAFPTGTCCAARASIRAPSAWGSSLVTRPHLSRGRATG